jgi:hypothetical protein
MPDTAATLGISIEGGTMMTTDDVVRDLMNYFAAIGANAHRTFSIRDFNTQVMMNTFEPEERACLHLALAKLVEDEVVQPVSATDYLLTDKGFNAARAIRQRSKAPSPEMA